MSLTMQGSMSALSLTRSYCSCIVKKLIKIAFIIFNLALRRLQHRRVTFGGKLGLLGKHWRMHMVGGEDSLGNTSRSLKQMRPGRGRQNHSSVNTSNWLMTCFPKKEAAQKWDVLPNMQWPVCWDVLTCICIILQRQ